MGLVLQMLFDFDYLRRVGSKGEERLTNVYKSSMVGGG